MAKASIKPMLRYGSKWPTGTSEIQIEMGCIAQGGRWEPQPGVFAGAGYYHHYRRLIELIWPDYEWNRWNSLCLEAISTHKYTGIAGPASSGKTNIAALWALAEYYTFPEHTTIICSTTTAAMLNMRVWGEIKEWHKKAKENHLWLPGFFIESKYMLTTDGKDVEARSLKNGIVGVACRIGGEFQGLANYIGIKNERIRLIADELQLMPATFLDSMANLNSNSSRGPDAFKAVGMGNPKDQTDALGKFCEPSDESGGWDGVEQGKKTCTWKTRLERGICVQLCGTDSPNYDFPGPPWRYRYLITPEKIEADAKYYGVEHPNFLMMNMGMFSKVGQTRRVITRALCIRERAMEAPYWREAKSVTKLLCLDASYSADGEGDRTVLIELTFGPDSTGKNTIAVTGNPIVVPISAKHALSPEDQIATYVKNEAELRGIPPERLFFDSTGRGSLVLSFARLWSPNVVGIEFGGPATKRRLGRVEDCSKKYHKFVSEMWFATRHLIEAGQCRGLPESLIEEGSMRAWLVEDRGFEDVEPKRDTKLRMGRSPDLYDAFVAGVEGARRLGFQIVGAFELHRASALSMPKWMQLRQKTFSTVNKTFTLSSA